MSESPSIGEQALNKATEIGLSSQLDEVENLDVNIKTDPLKMVQRQVNAVEISGEGLVMQKDLRMEELKMQMGNVSINPLSAAFGKTSDILNLSNFDLEGMSLRVKQLQVEAGKLTLQAEAYVEQIPSA
ncbi:DUF2993 domain-containing protein [Nostoc sp. PCC 7107]|uniref:LmeA family phospholipid-binding protein n=1 Tax=Nostoc sp. PCC 7107 TaxID=317936 RepID=UPI00029F31B3|nr:DUF2993 domain-containing protein [Nostoc sp. PCC 7107]AFY43018.1 hypothetical protein Nos7107_2409 [Nostoc sp. PCC 7107]